MNKIKVNEDKKKLIKIRERLFEEGVGMGIIIALHIHKSLNLKQIANRIGKLETTTLSNIKKLLSKNFIEIDSVKTAAYRGKYYKLDNKVQKVLKISDSKLDLYDKDTSIDDIIGKYIDSLTNKVKESTFVQAKMINNINSYIEKLGIIYLENTREKLLELDSDDEKRHFLMDKQFPIGIFEFSTKLIKINSVKQIIEIQNAMNQFKNELKRIECENEETDSILGYQYIYTSLSPVINDLD